MKKLAGLLNITNLGRSVKNAFLGSCPKPETANAKCNPIHGLRPKI